MSEVRLSVKVDVKEPYFDEVFDRVKELHSFTQKYDKGCLQYDLHTIKDKPVSFYLIERWENQQLLDEHMQKEHFVEFQSYSLDKVDNVEINFLEKYEG